MLSSSDTVVQVMCRKLNTTSEDAEDAAGRLAISGADGIMAVNQPLLPRGVMVAQLTLDQFV